MTSLIVRYPFATAMGFACTRGFLGDLTAQRYEQSDGAFVLDARRSATYASWGCVCCAFYDYLFYVIVMPRWWPTHVAGKLCRANVFKAVVFDATVLAPCMYFPAFYLFKENFLGGAGARPALERYGKEALTQNTYSLAFWTPTNVVMFSLVKPEYRVLFTSVTSLCYNALLSHVTEALRLSRRETRFVRHATRTP